MNLPPILPINEIISLKDKRVIVTGGAMGIGFGIAYRMAEAGAEVFLVDKNESVGSKASAELNTKGWKTHFVKADISIESEVKAALESVIKTAGSVDVLVNNAGIYPAAYIINMPVEDYERVMDINLKSAFMVTREVVEVMIAMGQGGKIINITSIDAIHPSSAGLAAYDASKTGLWGLTKSAAVEFAAHNIQVNAIAPGGIVTPGTGLSRLTVAEEKEVYERFTKKIPMKRLGGIDEIGKVALFLASDMASYITGAQIVVDGGVLLS